MKFKAFLIGLLISFGFPWLVAVVLPFASMRSAEPILMDPEDEEAGYYVSKRDGRIVEGSQVYGQEGCYHCHTQVIRPTYIGSDVHRDEWAGLKKAATGGVDGRRETLVFDFEGEEVAKVGLTRNGPDLANLGLRLEHHLKGTGTTPEEWLYKHLYNPRETFGYRKGDQSLPDKSKCPSKVGLFKKVSVSQGRGKGLPVATEENEAIIPTDKAEALVSYLVSLKKDALRNPIPAQMDYRRDREQTAEKK